MNITHTLIDLNLSIHATLYIYILYNDLIAALIYDNDRGKFDQKCLEGLLFKGKEKLYGCIQSCCDNRTCLTYIMSMLTK